MAGLNAQAKAWAYLRNKGKSKVKKQQQIPYGNDKQRSTPPIAQNAKDGAPNNIPCLKSETWGTRVSP
jgi:hypothetical protein